MTLTMTTPILETIQERLKSGQHGAYKDIAAVTGLNYSTVRRIAMGEIPNPGVETLGKLAAHLGLRLGISAQDTPSAADSNRPQGGNAQESGKQL